MSYSPKLKRAALGGLAASIFLTGAPLALHAAPSLEDLAAEIQALKSENKQMKQEISGLRGETRKTREKVKEAARPVYAAPGAPYPQTAVAVPVGATPIFATADKRLQIGALTITPGGFVALESVYRSRTEQADIGSQYQGIPFGPLAGTNEFRFTGRQSRISLLMEAPISPGLSVSGYGEFDFLGSGATSNENESNSYVPRIRHLYATVDSANTGFHFLAGQNWSLLTSNGKGIIPRGEDIPPTIDAQYVPGFTWKRQPQIRLTKDFGNGFWLGASAEEPQNTYTGCTTGVNATTINGNNVTCDILGANNLNGVSVVGGAANGAATSATAFSLNHVPDVVAKAAYDGHFGDHGFHVEGKGIYRDVYDRVANAAGTYTQNYDVTGWGVGGGFSVELLPKRLDLEASALTGRGIGSYGTAQFSDATFSPNGAANPLREDMLLAGLTYHATPLIDVYAFGGFEQVHADYAQVAGGGYVGYGAPNANNTGCYNDITSGTCGGNAQRVWQITGGFWDKIYKGGFGEVRLGLQYSYTQRQLFAGSGPTAATALPFAPKQDDQAVLTSFRYYPFQ